ncbi:MAG: ribonuclease PH [Endomicrobiales bacterium]|nr:ribonuclease PH [Endomicrobiales bacterium]
MKTRPIKITKNYIKHAEGSCMISMGNTMVLCVATVEEKVPPFIESRGTQQGWVTAEYSMLPRAGKERSSRQKGSSGGRSQEISRLIGRSLRAVVDMQKLGPRTIILDCDVIKADGGTRTASINGSFIALALAVKKLLKAGKITQNPINDYLGALSVGIVDGKKIPDLCYEQDVKAEVDMNIVSTGAGKLVEVQGTAEGKVFSRKDLNDLIDLAQSGIKEIIATQKTIMGKLN